MDIVLCRADMRLIHGQILNQWLLKTSCRKILIADDELAADEFMALMYQSLSPIGIDVKIMTFDSMAEYLDGNECENESVLLLCRTPVGFMELVKRGIHISHISLADKMFFSSKIKVDDDVKKAINSLIDHGVVCIAQIAPGDEPIELSKYKLTR